jgi:hypothetical protein
MKNKGLKQLSILLAMTAIMIIPYLVFAQQQGTINKDATSNPMTMLDKVAGESFAETDEDSLPRVLGLVVASALSLLGIIFIILMVLAGYNWMMASGNEQKIEEAKNTIKRAIIGLVIVLSAWAIWRFILENLIDRL